MGELLKLLNKLAEQGRKTSLEYQAATEDRVVNSEANTVEDFAVASKLYSPESADEYGAETLASLWEKHQKKRVFSFFTSLFLTFLFVIFPGLLLIGVWKIDSIESFLNETFEELNTQSVGNGAVVIPGYTYYDFSEFNYEIQIPERFVELESNPSQAVVGVFSENNSQDFFPGQILITKEEFDMEGTTPEEYFPTFSGQLQSAYEDTNFKMIGEKETTLGGFPARTFTFEYDTTGNLESGIQSLVRARIQQTITFAEESLYGILVMDNLADFPKTLEDYLITESSFFTY